MKVVYDIETFPNFFSVCFYETSSEKFRDFVIYQDRDDLEESWEAPKWMQKCSQTPLINKMGERMLVSRLAKSYDSAVWVEAPHFINYFGSLFDKEMKQ